MFSLILSSVAISRLLRPRASRRTTSISRAVRPAGWPAALFLGMLADLAADGVPVLRNFREAWFSVGGHLLLPQDTGSGDPAYLASRPYLEGHVRGRVRSLPNVSVRDRCEVIGLAATEARDRVTGVRVVPTDAGSAEQIIAADLVVDATGRGGRASAWLTQLEFEPPAEEQVRVDVQYATRYLRLRQGALDRVRFVVVNAEPARPTIMALIAQEGDRWILTLGGYGGLTRRPTRKGSSPSRVVSPRRTCSPRSPRAISGDGRV